MPRICCDDEEEPGPNAFHRRRPKLCKRSASPSFSFQLHCAPPLLLRIPPACHPLLSSRVLHSIHSSYSSWTAVTLGTRRHEPTNDNQLETPPSLLQPRRRHKEHDDWSYHAPSIIRLETSGTTPSLRTVTTTRSAHHSSTSAFGKSKIA